jgi:hypothetical protein
MYEYLTRLSPVIRKNPKHADDIANSFSATQLNSKMWLVNELCKQAIVPNPNILILGGWYGSFLIPLLLERMAPKSITLTDIDQQTVLIASQLHDKSPECNFAILDGDNPQYQFDVDVVINTSCEHMLSIGERAVSNPKCLYVLQSCDNTTDPGHINTVASTGEFLSKTNLATVLFSGRQNLGHKNRFMVIGYR